MVGQETSAEEAGELVENVALAVEVQVLPVGGLSQYVRWLAVVFMGRHGVLGV